MASPEGQQPGQREPYLPPATDYQPPSAFLEIGRLLGQGIVAAGKKVGGDMLRLMHFDWPAGPQPRTLSREEVQRWNVEHGFPKDWRN